MRTSRSRSKGRSAKRCAPPIPPTVTLRSRPWERKTNEAPATPARPRASPRVAALRLLAQRRLTEAQLWERLRRRGYEDADVAATVESCKRDGFVDDALFARLFVDGRVKAVGDARLVAELVRRGIARDAAKASVASAERDQEARLALAANKLLRARPNLDYPSVARALERLGFPAPAIYRHLRLRVETEGWPGAEPAREADRAAERM